MVININIKENLDEYKRLYINLLIEDLFLGDISNIMKFNNLKQELQNIPEGLPQELVFWHKNDLINDLFNLLNKKHYN